MSIYTFHPTSLAFVKNKAKQLQKVMPGMKLSAAQETTARALGFSSWFDCEKRIGSEKHQVPSVYDESLDRDSFVKRRHHQYCALAEIGGIPPHEAAHFVRVWALTSRDPAKHLSEYAHPYNYVMEGICAMEAGASYLQVDATEKEPRRIADGLVCGSIGTKNSYYVADQTVYSKLPAYIKGNSCCWLEWESGLSLPAFLSDGSPNRAEVDKAVAYLHDREPWHYEWLTQELCRKKPHRHTDLFSLLNQAGENPDAWFPLSYRTAYPEYPSIANSREYIPAVKGDVFVEFIESGGRCLDKDIQWFELPERHAISFFDLKPEPRVPLDVEKLRPCKAVYHSPFKHGPLSAFEYEWGTEGGGLALNDELDWDDH